MDKSGVTFIVKNQFQSSITDAIVTLGKTQNDPGDYVFEGLTPGNYTFQIKAESHMDFSGQLEVTDHNKTITVVLHVDDTGTDPVCLPAFTIFPNPAKDHLNVKFTNVANQPVRITLINMKGQVISTQYAAGQGSQQVRINLDKLPAGVYFLRIIYQEVLVPKKIVIL